MGSARANIIEKMVAGLLISGFIVFVLPHWQPGNFIGTSLLLFGITIISFALGRFLAGDSDKIMLVVIALVVVGEGILFALNPGSIR